VIAWLVHEVRSGVPRALLAPWRIAAFAAIGVVATVVAAWNAHRAGPVSDYWTAQVQVAQAGVGGCWAGASLVAYALIYRFVAPVPAGQAA
jgi:hypothetical protein